MRLKNESQESISIITLNEYSEFNKLDPWIYKNPTFDPASGTLSLDKNESLFELPKKIYGNSQRLGEIILKDYKPKGDTLGVLLVGKKGMGKSLLSEKIAMDMINRGYPVIHVTRPVSALAVEKAVEVLSPCLLYLEEFEKCFENPQDVPVFLNMFSSTTINGLMVVIAANSINSIIYDPLIDRPQRLRYRINYSEIDDNVVNDILADSEVSEEQKRVYTEWVKSSKPNIDSLITLVKLTSHIEDPSELVEFISILNVPKLNPLRYKLTGITAVAWNHPVVSSGNYNIKQESLVNPPTCNITISGAHKFTTEVDLTIEDPDKPGFKVIKVLESTAQDNDFMPGPSGKASVAKIELELEFELCRDAGKIATMYSVPITKDFKDKSLEVMRGGALVDGAGVRDMTQWLAWD